MVKNKDIKSVDDVEKVFLSSLIPELTAAITAMKTSAQEESKAMRQEMGEIRDELKVISEVQVQLAEVITNNRNQEKSLDNVWIEVKANREGLNALSISVNESCDITSRSNEAYTNKAIKSMWGKLALVAFVFILLGGVIYKDVIWHHISNTSLHVSTIKPK